jgi:uncharacterized protein (AIM24 family)
MPYEIKKLPHSNLVKMTNKETGRVTAKHTTMKKAKSQMRLLEGIEHGTLKKRKMY